jgi:hypothetical protein
LGAESLGELGEYDRPGNVREPENAVEHARTRRHRRRAFRSKHYPTRFARPSGIELSPDWNELTSGE